ncbi:MAG: type II secretion system GspH family protein [Acidobacteriota bacterium]|nr:type II secretion system GspH family protein [Acidobacteriota bacterium]
MSMKGKNEVRRRQKGFSLIELLTVVVILMLVTGVVFQQIDLVQKRSRQEDVKMDLTQESREFLDQMVRDLHTSGYPNKHMYIVNLFGASPNDQRDSRNAVGLVQVTPTVLWFEGDVDGDGQVDSIQYQLQSNGGRCPCTIRRSQVVKVNGTAPLAQAANFNQEVNNVINSGGAFPITGTSPPGLAAPDVLYGAYKAAPVFQAYDANGALVALPVDINANLATMSTIKTIRITINVLAGPEGTDIQTRMRPVVSMTAAARINN